ncbi:MAG: hypothetical protein KatS3mg129_2083 [Leptospiraceae bacterium]|nr:MAG: hypothetical protein KatS3mg129_2083 [Leptospiraceae bacterium]
MKYRKNKIKKEHHILEGFDKYLEKIAMDLPVQNITPGRIKKVNKANKGDLRITFQYPTQSGAKLLLKKGSTVQECFVVIDKENIALLNQYIKQEKYKE